MASFHNAVFLFLLSLATAAVAVAAGKSTTTTHLHFYMHDTTNPPTKATNVRAVVGPAGGPANLGDINVMDDPLTVGPSLAAESQPVGRVQGLYTIASLSPPQTAEFAFGMMFNLVFTAGEYNGSTLAILGRDAAFTPVRELSVVGGSGAFRMARGYALIKTFSWDQTVQNAVLELDVFVMH